MKESFIVRKKYQEQIKLLNTKQKAELLDVIFTYQLTQSVASDLDPLVSMLLSIMIQDWMKDDEAYLKKCEQNQHNGKLGGAKQGNQNARKNWQNNTKQANGSQNNQKQAKQAEYDSDSEYDSEEEKKKKEKYKDFVFLSPSEFQMLKELLGEGDLENYIEALNNYLGQKGKKYKSHYHTIRNRRNRDKKNKPPAKNSENYSSEARNLET